MSAVSRFFPPAGRITSPVQVETSGGAIVTFDPTAQAYLDVRTPQHATALDRRGWMRLPFAFGSTADRPTTGLHGGLCFYDLTLDKPIVHDGVIWRDVLGNEV